MSDRRNLFYTGYYQKSSVAGFGQIKIATGVTSEAGKVFGSVYALEDSTIDYDSACVPNEGDASFTSVPIAAKTYYYGTMENVKAVTGSVIGNLI